MKYWWYYIIAGLLLLHPHLAQKIEMLFEFFTNPDYQFWTTFSPMDFFDLILHAGLPLILIGLGIRKQLAKKNEA